MIHRFSMAQGWLAAGLIVLASGCVNHSTGKSSTFSSPPTALDRYVARPDSTYAHKLVATHAGKGFTAYVLELKSQTWLTTNEVDRPVWTHWLTIIRPDTVKHSKALLLIEGGGNGGNPPKSPDEKAVQIALQTHSIAAQLKMVPNQPLTFTGDKKGRVEDSMIAYTWDKFLRTGDEKWPARLPMTKSAVRAMDAISEFCASDAGGKARVDGFIVAGGSKRGWTTWTTAAVDKRVVGIVPLVIDVLNMEPSMLHHYGAYGFWAPAVGDYESQGIMNWMGTPQMAALLKIEEPYQYRDRFTMPKFIVNSAGDQFFLPDSSQFYFRDLPGVKYLRYIPNCDHSLKNTDAVLTVLACYDAVLNQRQLPEFDWSTDSDGALRVKTKTKPEAVKLWFAHNPKARDFRLESLGPAYKSLDLQPEPDGSYVGRVSKPQAGFTAYFVELTFNSGGPAPLKFTTDVKVIPDVHPYKFTPKPVR